MDIQHKISYILVTTAFYGVGTNAFDDEASMYEFLICGIDVSKRFQIVDARRCIVESDGEVTYQQVQIDFDRAGMKICDKRGVLIDQYDAPGSKPQEWNVVFYATFEYKKQYTAWNRREAYEMAEQDLESGKVDVARDGAKINSGFYANEVDDDDDVNLEESNDAH